VRIWTLHPRYLDAQGLVALWREALLAQNVLSGVTKGYKHHPQLTRFRAASDPAAAIASYLAGVLEEAARRGYSFDSRKISGRRLATLLDETRGQLLYEWDHLREKLKRRSPKLHGEWRLVEIPDPHPLFRIVPGGIEPWERIGQ
jgi:pyrimidine dimer DNA glycosylase